MGDASVSPMGELVSFVCIRADHQWGTAEIGQIHSVGSGLAYCPDGSLDTHERHEWRPCDAGPVSTAAGQAAHLAMLESAAY